MADNQYLGYPGSADKRIIKINLRYDVGLVTLNSGLELEIAVEHLQMLDDFKFDYHAQINAKSATVAWIENTDLVWGSLRQCLNACFTGSYPGDLICGLVQLCTGVKFLSFTYFAAPNFVTILEHITSPALTELTAHVVGTDSNAFGTFDALQQLGLRTGCSIRRMMLIFADAYPGSDVGVDAHQIFGNCLASDAIVYLLYSCEGDACMSRLVNNYQYESVGQVSMAINSPDVSAVEEGITFEKYYVFQKLIGGITWIIGCKKQNLQSFTSELPMVISSHQRVPFNPMDAQFEYLDIRTPGQQHQPPEKDVESVLAQFADSRNRVYNVQKFEFESTRGCCLPKSFKVLHPHFFMLPIWDTVRVSEVIYLLSDTRYRLSTGLIVQLPQMVAEASFYRDMVGGAAHRITFISTTQQRRWINANGLYEFLQNVRQIDFYGFWYSNPQINILERLPHECQVISMMRMKTDFRPIRFLLHEVPAPIREKMTKFFYDSRDTQEQSLGSIMNGIVYHEPEAKDFKHFEMLSSVFVVARTISETAFPTTMETFIEQMCALTSEGAVITICVHEVIGLSSRQKLGLLHGNDVLVPGIFSSRHHGPGWVKIMKQFKIEAFKRTWYIIEPRVEIYQNY